MRECLSSSQPGLWYMAKWNLVFPTLFRVLDCAYCTHRPHTCTHRTHCTHLHSCITHIYAICMHIVCTCIKHMITHQTHMHTHNFAPKPGGERLSNMEAPSSSKISQFVMRTNCRVSISFPPCPESGISENPSRHSGPSSERGSGKILVCGGQAQGKSEGRIL